MRATINLNPPIGSINKDPAHYVQAAIVYFQNTSSTACTVYGYPGAATVDANGEQVQQALRTISGKTLGLPPGQTAIPVVTLHPGAYASAGLEGVSTKEAGAAQAGCDASGGTEQILVTPPNTSTPVPFNAHWPLCFSFTVHPVNIENNPPA